MALTQQLCSSPKFITSDVPTDDFQESKDLIVAPEKVLCLTLIKIRNKKLMLQFLKHLLWIQKHRDTWIGLGLSQDTATLVSSPGGVFMEGILNWKLVITVVVICFNWLNKSSVVTLTVNDGARVTYRLMEAKIIDGGIKNAGLHMHSRDWPN